MGAIKKYGDSLLINFLPAVKYTADWWNGTELKKAGKFKAISYKGIIYPQGIQSGKEVFIRGTGYVKGKPVNVPLFSGLVKDYDTYMEKYGKYCMYYSLTNGRELNSGDLADGRSKNEFEQLVYFGIEKFVPYMDMAIELDNIVQTTILQYFENKNNYFYKSLYESVRLIPTYNLGFSFMLFPASMDVVRDDKKLERAYCEFEFMKHCKKNGSDYYDGKFEFIETLRVKIENGASEFPECMDDRIKLLYGERASELYKKLISVD